MTVAHAFLCDFDGTVAPRDIGAAFVRRFSGSRDPGAAARIARWRAGRIGTREVIRAECRALVVTEERALAYTRRFALDPDFAPFAREVRRRGGRLMVVSEGFDFYVRDHLERAGLGTLPWAANRARFARGGMSVEFPPAPGGCGRCGTCKGLHVRRHRALGLEVVLVGDGLSDRCGARAADHVLARGDLLDFCRAEGIAATPFRGFADVAAFARRLARRAAAPRARAAGARGTGG